MRGSGLDLFDVGEYQWGNWNDTTIRGKESIHVTLWLIQNNVLCRKYKPAEVGTGMQSIPSFLKSFPETPLSDSLVRGLPQLKNGASLKALVRIIL